ncbi:hypothetical protein ACEPAI_4692 [Sanghuangporus weigelae]
MRIGMRLTPFTFASFVTSIIVANFVSASTRTPPAVGLRKQTDSSSTSLQSQNLTALDGIQALTFDVFGTVVDWRGSIVSQLTRRAARSNSTELKRFTEQDWQDFATEWRQGYMNQTTAIANGAEGPLNVDVLFRQLLDEMLTEERWVVLKTIWSEADLEEVNMVWHFLNGWPDTSEGLHLLKKKFIISTLTNGDIRLMVDMAKHSNLPWDSVLTADLLGAYKPNAIVYRSGARFLALEPEQCAMVAAHLPDLRAAIAQGLRSVYVRRPTEDEANRNFVATKDDGGEVDVIVDSFEELAEMLGV